MKARQLISVALLALSVSANAQVGAPKPVAPLPTKHQVAWQQMETYAFIHFGPNTFCDREWGYGDAPLECFNPTRLDCEQWAKTLKEGGMKGIIITAKHHDGFCLWPTKYTDYSVRNTPYKDGKGDIVGELAAACKKYGLKFGVYLSPWDRHQAFYGTPLYREYFHAQLHELLTQYGDIFEVWFDGANGGDGYYGGAREARTIDRRTYYDYPRAWETIYKYQPQAIIFSDGGPGCRWVGNENGYAGATNWSFLWKDKVYPGYDKYRELQYGHADGDLWVAAECDVSIRPGWFYHEKEDDKVKSVDHLVDLYYRSVGHNGTFLLNMPVDKEGRIHPIDSARVIAFHKQVTAELKDNLLKTARIKASDVRGKAFAEANLTDGNYDTYWCVKDGVNEAELTINFKKSTKLNRLMLQEYIPLGQRVKSFSVYYRQGKEWTPVKLNEETTTIGYKRLLRFKTIQTQQLRIVINDARGPVCLNELGAYYAPNAKESYVEKVEDVKSLSFTAAANGTDAVIFDLGKEQQVKSFYYLPDQSAKHEGLVANYELYVGNDKAKMTRVAAGEFSNIRNHPIMQEVHFTPTNGRYVMLKATRMVTAGEKLKYDKIAIQ
ncbi:MAG: alpha-L-fucosidase [Prevotella sp.]